MKNIENVKDMMAEEKKDFSDALKLIIPESNCLKQLSHHRQISHSVGHIRSRIRQIHHETVTDNDRYFTLKLSIYQGAGSGMESYKFYI